MLVIIEDRYEQSRKETRWGGVMKKLQARRGEGWVKAGRGTGMEMVGHKKRSLGSRKGLADPELPSQKEKIIPLLPVNR